MKHRFVLTGIAAILTALSSASHAAPSLCSSGTNLVANCGFETGTFSGWTLSGNDVPGQQDTLYGVETTDPIDGIAPHSGTQQAFFGDLVSNATTLSQTLTTIAGRRYTISFYVAQDTTPGTGIAGGNTLAVTFNGVTLLTSTQVPVENYTFLTFTGMATSTSTPFSLTLGNSLGEFLLDDVRVAVATVPEPATLPLLALAAGAIGLVKRRKRPR